MTATNARLDAGAFAPWPMQQLRDRLLQGDTLFQITGPKRKVSGYDVREVTLEAVVQQVMVDTFGADVLEPARRSIANTLDVPGGSFPASAMPDIVIRVGGKVHIMEVKSGRTDYSRFDNVITSGVQQFLVGIGDGRAVPWEVEQDLMRLMLYPALADEVGSCLFVMVDAYDRTRGGRSWTAAFSSPRIFRETVKTRMVRDKTEMLLQATTIEDLTTTNASARLITCLVHPWVR